MKVRNKDVKHPKNERKVSTARKGKVLYKMRTRSGYVIVRSAANSAKRKGESNKLFGKIKAKTIHGEGSAQKPTNDIHATRNKQQEKLKQARLNPALVETGFANSVKKKWEIAQPFSNALAIFTPSPFKVIMVRRILSNNAFLEKLTSELLSVPFRRLDNDLYSFEQTSDLFELNGEYPVINSFLQVLTGPLLSWMEHISGKKLSGKITATGSKYGYTDHLLCHDDNLSDRSIAFILYLSKDWTETDGGALQLFSCKDNDTPHKVVHSIYPEFGAFAFFEVTSRSYHQVQEVLKQNKVRLSINGWFHGEELPVKSVVVAKPLKFSPPVSPEGCSLKKWIKPCWLDSENHVKIKAMFCDQLSVNLPNFVNEKSFCDLEKALLSKDIIWKKCGPAHQRNYERAKLSTLPPLMGEFLKFLKSKYMFYFLTEVTVDIDPDSPTTPLCHLEVQRWSPGNYTLLVDNDPNSNVTGIDVHLYFNVEKQKDGEGGTVHYMGPDKDSDGFLEVNAQLSPERNSLFLVAHIAGMKPITKYINHCQNLHFHKIIATYSQG